MEPSRYGSLTASSAIALTAVQIRAVAAVAGIAYDLPEGYVHFETNKTPEFTAKFPHGKIPAWEGKDGFLLFESAAIARYCASPLSRGQPRADMSQSPVSLPIPAFWGTPIRMPPRSTSGSTWPKPKSRSTSTKSPPSSTAT